jgi:uncharacterized protein YkwD
VRPSAVVALLAVLASLAVGAADATAATAPTTTIAAANALESQVLAELNATRREHGLAPLRLALPLAAAADSHSRTMGRFGFFSHDSRDGTDFSQRVKRYYGPGRAGTWSVGENLLWASPTIDPAAALRMWMGSPGHRKNVLNPRWREIGLSAVAVASAPGVFGGRDVIIVTADFGVRS